ELEGAEQVLPKVLELVRESAPNLLARGTFAKVQDGGDKATITLATDYLDAHFNAEALRSNSVRLFGRGHKAILTFRTAVAIKHLMVRVEFRPIQRARHVGTVKGSSMEDTGFAEVRTDTGKSRSNQVFIMAGGGDRQDYTKRKRGLRGLLPRLSFRLGGV